jgi:hypothetical protein
MYVFKILHNLTVFAFRKLRTTAIDSLANCPYNRQLDGCAKREFVAFHIVVVDMVTKGLQSYCTRMSPPPTPFPHLADKQSSAKK